MSDFWTDWSQNKRIRETEDQIAAVSRANARARSQLAAQMRDQHGNLQAQIDRLTKAFVAMVDYEDIRGELNEYADAAAIRRFARSVIAATMAGGFGLSTIPVPADATDYWLHPATRGLTGRDQGVDGRGAPAAGTGGPARPATDGAVPHLDRCDHPAAAVVRRPPRQGAAACRGRHLRPALPVGGGHRRPSRRGRLSGAGGRVAVRADRRRRPSGDHCLAGPGRHEPGGPAVLAASYRRRRRGRAERGGPCQPDDGR